MSQVERRKACEDELQVLEEEHRRIPFLKTMATGKSFLRIDNLQFFAKKDEDEDEVEEIEEEEEEEKPKPKGKSKSKSEEDAPQWAKSFMSTIQEVIKPKEQEQGKQQVPVPEVPVVEEEEEEEEVKKDSPVKRFLSQFW